MAINEAEARKALSHLLSALGPDAAADDLPDFAFLIKSQRQRAGMSLADVARAMGITKSHLWDTEQGKTNPSTKFVWEICKVLPIDPLVALQAAAMAYSRKGAFQHSHKADC